MITTRQAMLSMWTKPRATIAQLCEASSPRAMMMLVMLGGVVSLLDKAVTKSVGDKVSLPIILATAVVFGPIFSLVGFYIGPWILAKTGTWIGGNGDRSRLRVAWAWSNAIPLVIGLLYIPEILVFGNELFTSTPPTSPTAQSVMLGLGILEFLLGCWAFVVTLKAFGEAQGFSAWKALLSMVIAFMVAVLPVGLVIAGIVIFTIRA